ncbi:hypothetical protein PoB_006790500 [Plakobranchus ocellatus]|uniref:Uncharacterized protein n=1 Tax=Plakobranchus ocellatus TaxID=259542 RepID=A0AAV4DBS6_9GAST|nr:hypothetical protein PoB_006790500 [Plakobranchus ocellatus]
MNIDSPCTLAGSYSQLVFGMTVELEDELFRDVSGFLVLSLPPPLGWARKLLCLDQELRADHVNLQHSLSSANDQNQAMRGDMFPKLGSR